MLLHLQAAACGQPSPGTVRAVAAHLQREADEGGYVAAAAAEPVLHGLRAGIGDLFGHPGRSVFLTTGATDSLDRLLRRWPLPAGAEVAVTPGEWGPHLRLFRAAGLGLRTLEVDPHGRLDLAALDRTLRTSPPAAVHLVQLASHRALEQPVAEALDLCRAAGVPLWVDAAQALAHRDAASGADAVYAPARKWLAAPRGVGFLAVAEPWRERFAGLDDEEASVASRVGAAHALTELDPTHVPRREEVGALLRDGLQGVRGWALADPPAARGALLGLRPTAGQHVETVQRRLHEEHRILTTACLPWRAPGDLSEPLLRLAPARLVAADVERVAAALTSAK